MGTTMTKQTLAATVLFLGLLSAGASAADDAATSAGASASASRGDNTPPPGFVALFNGNDLAGWKGLLAEPYDNPFKRAAMSPDQRAKAQKAADDDMRKHWRAENGVIVFDGKGRSLATAREDYGNFEMYVDWKILP